MHLARLIFVAVAVVAAQAAYAVPDTVRFTSADGRTELVGYLFKPAGPGRYPAIVMLHGRSGAYSRLKPGQYTADALTARHRMWGELWARNGFVALLVDSFGPRGYPAGFPKHSYSQRPAEVSERFVRPLDAYGALAYLRTRPDVASERIGLHGWSNGAMTLLSTMTADAPGMSDVDPHAAFRAGLALYPSCRTQAKQPGYQPYAPLLILSGSADEEVSAEVCRRFAEGLRARGLPVEFVLYDDAHHAYDEPGRTKQSHAPNRAALSDTLERAQAFFAQHLKQ